LREDSVTLKEMAQRGGGGGRATPEKVYAEGKGVRAELVYRRTRGGTEGDGGGSSEE